MGEFISEHCRAYCNGEHCTKQLIELCSCINVDWNDIRLKYSQGIELPGNTHEEEHWYSSVLVYECLNV